MYQNQNFKKMKVQEEIGFKQRRLKLNQQELARIEAQLAKLSPIFNRSAVKKLQAERAFCTSEISLYSTLISTLQQKIAPLTPTAAPIPASLQDDVSEDSSYEDLEDVLLLPEVRDVPAPAVAASPFSKLTILDDEIQQITILFPSIANDSVLNLMPKLVQIFAAKKKLETLHPLKSLEHLLKK